jgi:tryptophanyl-tRNA synthetase
MITDPARARLSDPGNPAICPVFSLHEIYSDDATRNWITEGCTSAGIGCIDCKKPLIEAVNAEQTMMRERAKEFEEDPDLVHSILQEGAEKARDVARETLDDVRAAIGIGHR